MSNNYKYVGTTVSGYWDVIKYENKHYLLRNKYNGTEVSICSRSMANISKGITEVSKIVYYRVSGRRTFHYKSGKIGVSKRPPIANVRSKNETFN